MGLFASWPSDAGRPRLRRYGAHGVVSFMVAFRPGRSLRPGYACRWIWQRGGKVTGTVNLLALDDRLILSYRHRSIGGEWQDETYPALIARTPCHYGGSRPWFVCPDGCGRRVAIHWRPDLCLPALPSPCLCQHARGDGRSSCQTCRPNPGPARVGRLET
jgi:hypothetical protein